MSDTTRQSVKPANAPAAARPAPARTLASPARELNPPASSRVAAESRAGVAPPPVARGAGHDFGQVSVNPPTRGTSGSSDPARETGAGAHSRSTREGGGAAEKAPPEVTETARFGGQPLDARTRSFMESRFGHDFSQVRIHADARASEAAQSVGARAYTLGSDVVFRAGQYKPETREGKRTLAHELAHVVQQDGGGANGASQAGRGASPTVGKPEDKSEQAAARASESVAGGGFAPALAGTHRTSSPMVQREPDEWNKIYGNHSARTQSFDDYKNSYGKIKSTTEDGGRGIPAVPEISMDMLKKVYPGLAKDVDDPKEQARAKTGEKAEKYRKSLNQAFKMMKIDTVEAQANYLSHAFVESDQFRQFTETQGAVKSATGESQKWDEDYKNVRRDVGNLKKTYVPVREDTPDRKKDTAEDIKRKKAVNPNEEKGDFEFIGRGPVQVTDKYNYAEVVAVIEIAAEQYQKEADDLAAAKKDDTQAKEYAALAKRAAKAIKSDPREAANPEYTFLVSAAHMKRRHSDKSVGWASPGTTWQGDDAGSNWVAGSKQTQKPQVDALKEKSKAYDRIYPLLLDEAQKKNPAAKAKLEAKENVQARKYLKNWRDTQEKQAAHQKKADEPKAEKKSAE